MFTIIRVGARMIAKIILFSIFAIELLLGAYYHGKDKTGRYSFWLTCIGSILFIGLMMWSWDWVI